MTTKGAAKKISLSPSSYAFNPAREVNAAREVKNVALIGSSGGGTATLGHTNAETLLKVIHEQLQQCGGRLIAACFVALDAGKGMDGVNEQVATATAFIIETSEEKAKVSRTPTLKCRDAKRGTLKDVNDYVKLTTLSSLAVFPRDVSTA